MEVLIVGAGVGGLTLALELHRHGIGARVFEAAAEIRPVGLGINLPHTTRGSRGSGSRTRSPGGGRHARAVFFNRFTS
jgi:cation diffusion facilitator CzcD-associated flavoprotein CzcO